MLKKNIFKKKKHSRTNECTHARELHKCEANKNQVKPNKKINKQKHLKVKIVLESKDLMRLSHTNKIAIKFQKESELRTE